MEDFNWYDGYNTKGFLGVPTYYNGNDLWFTSTDFDLTANSSSKRVIKSDTMEINFASGFSKTIARILVDAWGDYSIINPDMDNSCTIEITLTARGASAAPERHFSPVRCRLLFDEQTDTATGWHIKASFDSLASAAPPVIDCNFTLECQVLATSSEYGIASVTLHTIKVTPTGTFVLPRTGDFNDDNKVDSYDSTCFIKAITGPTRQQTLACNPMDLDDDGDVDLADFSRFQIAFAKEHE